jgi:RecA-family ATPase
VAGESEHLGRRINGGYRNIIYVSTEDDILSLSPRIKREKDYFRSGTNFDNLRFIFDNENLLGRLRDEYSRQNADCIVLDAFGDIFEGDINSSTATRSFMNDYKNFADEAGCAVVFLHHNRKAAASGNPDKSDLLGSMAIEAKGRSVLMLSQSDSRVDRRVLRVVKGNYLTPEEKKVNYELSFIDGIFDIVSTANPYVTSTTGDDIRDLVYQYREAGHSIRDISELLKTQGHDVSKSAVGRYLKG